MRGIIVFIFIIQHLYGQGLTLELLATDTNASFRGLSVVDDSVVWISGSNGWVGVSKNGGKHWTFQQVSGYEKMDFRSLHAFSGSKAIIANAGSPASILMTNDGGNTWKEVYRDERKEVFIDGVDFRDSSQGIVYGDPIQGRLMMIQTKDGGNTWTELSSDMRPVVSDGEASFAASGTGIRYMGKNTFIIATGGVVSRLLKTNDGGKHWLTLNPPIIQGTSSRGIFSFVFSDNKRGVVVGGDYLVDTLKINHVFYTKDGGAHWIMPPQPTRGYRECVENVKGRTFIAVGPAGIDVSYNQGLNWLPMSEEKGFHVIRKARKGSLTVLAGSKGKIGLIK